MKVLYFCEHTNVEFVEKKKKKKSGETTNTNYGTNNSGETTNTNYGTNRIFF